MKDLLIGQKVIQREITGTIVDYIEPSRHLLIQWDNDNAVKTYVFPDLFLAKQYMAYPCDDSNKLKQALATYDIYKCSQCHEYSKEIRKIAKHKLCPSCARSYKICAQCGELFKEVSFGLDGRNRCRKCFGIKYPPIHANMSASVSNLPTLYVRSIIPFRCANQHKMFCVSAKVTVVKNGIYQNTIINLHYCEERNKYYILARSFDEYTKLHGYICLPRDMPRRDNKSGRSHSFQEDTILSRWGYSTTLPDEGRRQILVFLIQSGVASKSEISSILHTFSGRYWLPDAPSIWRSDLYFVEDYDLDRQPFVDFTKL